MKKLLLQICCAPCGTYISRDLLLPHYQLTWFFCNPNLVSQEEYDRRLEMVRMMAGKYGIPLLVDPYNHESWQEIICGHEKDSERGQRCQICYRQRLAKTARLAKEMDFDIFGTTLLVSPYKDGAAIRKIGHELEEICEVAFLDMDFQAHDGYRRSQELAKELELYRQKFCGCEYSLQPAGKIKKNSV